MADKGVWLAATATESGRLQPWVSEAEAEAEVEGDRAAAAAAAAAAAV